MCYSLAFIRPPGGVEWLIILVVALLIFGKRLPELGRSLGKGLVEFKKGLKGMQEEMNSVDQQVNDAVNRPTPKPAEPARLDASTTSGPAITEKSAEKIAERSEPT